MSKHPSEEYINPLAKKFKLQNSHLPAEKDQYEGLALPPNSELLKNNSHEALKAYQRLLKENQTTDDLINAQLVALPLNLTCPHYFPENVQLLINTIPTLDNLATQILRIIAQGPYQKILDIVANQDSTLAGISYKNLIELFEMTKRIYSTEDPFLNVEHLTFGIWKYGCEPPSFLKGKEDSVESTLRKVNLATFLNATLGTNDAGFYHLNESFLDVFCPSQSLDPSNTMTNLTGNSISGYQEGETQRTSANFVPGKLLKSQAGLYLDLKTQAYISALEINERPKDEILEDLFPDNMDEILLKRKNPDMELQLPINKSTAFTPAESDFISRANIRKQRLQESDNDSKLAETYEWLVFLKELFDYVSKNVGILIWGRRGRLGNLSQSLTTTLPASPIELKKTTSGKSGSKEAIFKDDSKDATPVPTSASKSSTPLKADGEEEGNLKLHPNFEQITNELLPSEIQKQQILLISHPNKIRQGYRRPWTEEEERALKQALELKGPHWSQILELFGAGGKISEALKNRTQIQLKDKARNWKMFFLKNNFPVPSYLTKVTGDLDRDEKSSRRNKSKKPRVNAKNIDPKTSGPIKLQQGEHTQHNNDTTNTGDNEAENMKAMGTEVNNGNEDESSNAVANANTDTNRNSQETGNGDKPLKETEEHTDKDSDNEPKNIVQDNLNTKQDTTPLSDTDVSKSTEPTTQISSELKEKATTDTEFQHNAAIHEDYDQLISNILAQQDLEQVDGQSMQDVDTEVAQILNNNSDPAANRTTTTENQRSSDSDEKQD
ncbi:Telobox-containing general regulatory factor [Komagataella phaffii CBS 7435]|uniref:Telobox-containing general regulatory factor n=2 Tax=Komagataella phaffii TaxID=460519 RepID=C4QXZ4_KOMPG|nr:Telobox-containing general regulatory factor [Komagataella phaffii GS115]AOA61705.1 GQ67_01895T0 [Komagataella phaffii]CAH2446937.1 Telobox-containing general regulatory factor [Komagataella phaffii CBS 7435]AOA66849.1 GQ68_01910T0 [Komagataella phaffii GS115]CAY68117.1 Telobox-containing general regulatory factor [Komagataella phaffii GS115]CCA37193.1 Telobox-containing general regulatory factor [Komagataella phaffii CBS 7435]